MSAIKICFVYLETYRNLSELVFRLTIVTKEWSAKVVVCKMAHLPFRIHHSVIPSIFSCLFFATKYRKWWGPKIGYHVCNVCFCVICVLNSAWELEEVSVF